MIRFRLAASAVLVLTVACAFAQGDNSRRSLRGETRIGKPITIDPDNSEDTPQLRKDSILGQSESTIDVDADAGGNETVVAPRGDTKPAGATPPSKGDAEKPVQNHDQERMRQMSKDLENLKAQAKAREEDKEVCDRRITELTNQIKLLPRQAGNSQEIQELRKRLEFALRRKHETVQDLTGLNTQIVGMQKQIDGLRTDVDDLIKFKGTTTTDITQMKTDIRNLQQANTTREQNEKVAAEAEKKRKEREAQIERATQAHTGVWFTTIHYLQETVKIFCSLLFICPCCYVLYLLWKKFGKHGHGGHGGDHH